MMSNKIINIIVLNKMFIRNINNEYLKKALNDLMEIKPDLKNDKIFNQSIKRIELDDTLKEDLKEANEIYQDVLKNLKESEDLLKITREHLKIVKERTLNLNIEIQDVTSASNKLKIDNLNIDNKYHQKDINIMNNIKQNDIDHLKNIEENINISSNIKKSIWDISWLEPFINFIHNHSSLILTIGGGLIVGGAWYFNNIGYINIGSILSRLGINIFTNANQLTSIPSFNTAERSNKPLHSSSSEITHGFFRQLGIKVLELLDVIIEKMKDKRLKYK